MKRKNTKEEIRDLILNDFFLFFNYLKPEYEYTFSWWHREMSMFLQNFMNNDKRYGIILAPPQHGKSEMINHFMAWSLIRDRSKRILFSSYGDYLGLRANKTIRSILLDKKILCLFAQICGGVKNTKVSPTINNRTIDILQGGEIKGYFFNTTIEGVLTGMTGDILVIDDPYKNVQDSHSKIIREKIKRWFEVDFASRRSQNGKIILIMTRWNVFDLGGQILRDYSEYADVFRYPAIAIEDEVHRKKGEALAPKVKDIDFLRQRKREMVEGDFQAQYQQNPILSSRSFFKKDFIRMCDSPGEHHRVIANIDYAFGGDTNALSVCFLDTRRKRGYVRGYIFEESIVNIYHKVMDVLVEHKVEYVFLENNQDKMGTIKNHLIENGFEGNVFYYHERESKENKIKHHGVYRLHRGEVMLLKDSDSKYLEQILTYGSEGSHDDAPDSISNVCREIFMDRRVYVA